LLYALPLLGFLPSPDLLGGMVIQVVRGLGCVLVTASVVVFLQRNVPSEQSSAMLGLTHSLVLFGTSVGALLAPVMLHLWGLSATLWVSALSPVLLQVCIAPFLLGMHRTGSIKLAALEPRTEVLRGLALFEDASRSTLVEIADHAQPLHVEPGVALVVQGEPADALYILLHGQVEVTQLTAGPTILLRLLDAPSFFGEIGLIHAIPRTATVTATTSCALWRVSGDVFLSAAAASGLSGALTENARIQAGTLLAGAIA
jgi:hypothetical protein